jgi:hypothetical protein
MLVLLAQVCLATVVVFAIASQVPPGIGGYALLAGVQVAAGVLATEGSGTPGFTFAVLVWLVAVGRLGRDAVEPTRRSSTSPR